MPIEGDYPIVLAHGICRFDQLLNVTFGVDNAADDGLHYFKRIRSTLLRAGFEVHHANVDWAAGVERRADQLRTQIERLTDGFAAHAKVHIIAHSMGGLDARHMIYRHRIENRIASLTTIGTPHHGTCFADWSLRHLSRLIPVLRLVGLDVAGFRDLTTERCAAFNTEAAHFEATNGVKYQTFAGVREQARTFWLLQRPGAYIEEHEGPNDGLVSLASARWRDDLFVETIDADHLNEVGWTDPATLPFGSAAAERFEEGIRAFYLKIARGL